MRDKDHLIKHGNIMVVAAVLSGLFNWGYNFIMVRMLGTGSYGVLYPLFAIIIIANLSASPIQPVIAKYISSFKLSNQIGKMSYLMFRVFRKMSIYFGIILVAYLVFSKSIASVMNVSILTPVVITGFVLFFSLLFPIGFGAFQGLERFVQLGTVQVLSGFFRLSFGILLVSLKFDVTGAMTANLIAAFLIIVIALWFLRDIWTFRPYDKDIMKSDIYKYFVPVTIAYVSFAIACYSDPIAVRICFGKDSLEVGYYSIVSMIGKAFLFLPMSVTTAMFPKVSDQYELGKETGHLLKKALLYSCAGCFIGILICIFLPKLIIYIVMSRADITQNALATMIPLFRLIGFAIIPYGLACIVINYHLARRKYDFIPLLILGTLVQLVLFVLFHQTLIQILLVLLVSSLFILISSSIYLHPRFIIDKLSNRR